MLADRKFINGFITIGDGGKDDVKVKITDDLRISITDDGFTKRIADLKIFSIYDLPLMFRYLADRILVYLDEN